MSLRKWCSPTLPADHPLRCANSPDCDHHWFYDFRVNRKRYRNTTETANKQEAKKIEARERSRVLEHRHGIRRQPDITFKTFANTYIDDYAKLHKRSVSRDEEIIKVLNRVFGSLILHEITAHRIEQFKRERLAGKWRGHGYKSSKPIKPGTVNRELNCLRGILSKAVEWGKLLEHPMRNVKQLKLDNRRTRILTEDEQIALLTECRPKMRRFVQLALLTGARAGELLTLKWDDVTEDELIFWNTKNGKTRRLPLSDDIRAVLASIVRSRVSPWVFTNKRTHGAFTSGGMNHTFKRALERAGIDSSDISLHTLRHTALSRMVANGYDTFTVMAIAGHSSTRMLERYTHPTQSRKAEALTLGPMGRIWAERESEGWKEVGGRHRDRTGGLRIANASRKKR